MPICTDPRTVQTPEQPWMQSQEIGEAPQVLLPQLTRIAPPAAMKHSWPAGQVRDEGVEQATGAHAPVVTCQRAAATLPATQDATVRPAPAQSS
jgi:hypothetical protein